jgi:acetoin utilization deacetylase AcuC-like enzyme
MNSELIILNKILPYHLIKTKIEPSYISQIKYEFEQEKKRFDKVADNLNALLTDTFDEYIRYDDESGETVYDVHDVEYLEGLDKSKQMKKYNIYLSRINKLLSNIMLFHKYLFIDVDKYVKIYMAVKIDKRIYKIHDAIGEYLFN